MRDQNNFEDRSEKSGSKHYKVGNKKPPKETQFPPGVSGNPNGRPKGSKNKKGEKFYHGIDDIVLSEAYREVEVTENGRKVKMPVVQAVVRTQTVKAAKGDTRAAVYFTRDVRDIERRESEDKLRLLEQVIEYKSGWEKEIQRCRALGLKIPELEFYPDNILIDYETGDVMFGQSMSEEGRKSYKLLRDYKSAHLEGIKIYKKWMKDPKNAEYLDDIKALLEQSNRMVARLEQFVPD